MKSKATVVHKYQQNLKLNITNINFGSLIN